MPERVSAVIPAYNAARCVGRAIDSVLGQTFRGIEVIVVNDGSTDDTAAVVGRYADRVRMITKPNGGLSSARNAGIRSAAGQYVAFLDADDWWLPQKIERQVAWMDAHPDAVFCSTAATVINGAGETTGEWRCGHYSGSTLEGIFARNAYVAGSGSAVLARRDALFAAGGFDERLKSLEDIDMWMRLAVRGGYHCIAEPLAVVEKRSDSMSRNLDVMREAAMQVMRKNRGLLPADKRGAFWRTACASMLSDYAKWAYRTGRRRQAVADLLTGMRLAPLRRGRLLLGLLAAMLRNQPV
jgi:glycosyltransferase involved in cell wall biosynthesis